MRRKTTALAATIVAGLFAGMIGKAQETPPAPDATAAQAPKDAAKKEPAPYRPIEGPVIINLPSTNVPAEGTLTVFFTHRFQQPVQDSNIRSLFSFDSGAFIQIGLGYTPVRNFDVSFFRSSFNSLGIYELAGKYRFVEHGPFELTLRVGDDLRTAQFQENHSSFFVQAIASVQLGSRVRITAVPTYLAKTTGQNLYGTTASVGPNTLNSLFRPLPVYRNIFNVPVAASIALTHSITIHGEVIPNYPRDVQLTQTLCSTPNPENPVPVCQPSNSSLQRISPGIGWSVSIEKTLLRHRFSFTAGNLNETTVDQQLASLFNGKPKNIYLGFNIVRQWKLK